MDELVGALVRVTDGREFVLGYGNVRVGRKKGSDLVFKDRTISRHHADITYESGSYVVYDNSSSGTWINGTLIVGAQRLRDGDSLKLGDIEFRFRWVPASTARDWHETEQGRSSQASTLSVKGGRAKPERSRRRGRRFLRLILVLVLLLVIAAAAVDYFYPELVQSWLEQITNH